MARIQQGLPAITVATLIAGLVGYISKQSGEARYSEFTNDGKWKGYALPPLPER